MSRSLRTRVSLPSAFLLATLAGCQDPTDPPVGMQPQAIEGSFSTWTVNSPNDPGDGICDATDCTLREAINVAASGDRVVFESTLQGDILLAAGQLSIDKSLTIDGAGRIAVDAQRNSRVISVASAQSTPQVTLAGLTFKNGYADRGAGVAVGISVLTLDGVTVSHNESTLDGGGIYVGLGSVNVLNGTIVENTAAENGGGIYLSGAAEFTLVKSTVARNTAGGAGGAAFSSAGANATVSRSTISGNRAAGGAGIVNVGTLQLRSSTIFGNIASQGVGGLSAGGSTSIANSIIAGNRTSGQNTPHECQAFGTGFTTLGHNLTTDLVSCDFGGTDLGVGSAQLATEVLEPTLADNGGPTLTHALIARGRAADAGYCPGESEDQRGFVRPMDDPLMANALDACDIGAYELQGAVAAVADLMISQSVNKTSVKQGEFLTYSIRVQNLGPETAPNVVVTDILPTGATFVEARHNKGTHQAPPSGETGTVTWSVGEMLNQDNEVAEITVTVLVRGKTTITNTASVTGDVSDPNQANNSASIRVSVVAGSTGKTGGKK